MNVSIIIVNYNTKELINNCLESIFEQTLGIPFEVIVVDNDSNDGSQKNILQNFPNIKYIGLNKNIGFGLANNEGLKIATGKNILFLNPDTKLLNNAVKILSDYLDNNDNVGACGGNLFNENMNPTHSYRLIFPSIFLEINDLFLRIPEKIIFGRNCEHNYSNKNKSVAYITGADLFVKKSILDQEGWFSPLFFMYYEETDLCYRINKAGFKVRSIPEAKIQHLEGKCFGENKISQHRINLSETSRKAFYSKNYSKTYSKIVNVIYIFNIKLKILLKKLMNKESDHYWESILNGFKSAK